jgi:hypothetical protein
MSIQTSSAVLALLAGMIGASAVEAVKYLLGRKKTSAEIGKLEAETDKLRLETGQLRAMVASVDYRLAGAAERVVYDSVGRDVGFDFEGRREFVYRMLDGHGTAVGEKGRGTLNIEEGGVLNIQRTNTEGRFEVWLQRYWYDGAEKAVIPRSEVVAGQRNLRITCEAKVIGGDHTLRFLLKNEKENNWLAYELRRVTSASWTPIKVHLIVLPTEECRLRIDDEEVSLAPSSIQIRNLVVTERTG